MTEFCLHAKPTQCLEFSTADSLYCSAHAPLHPSPADHKRYSDSFIDSHYDHRPVKRGPAISLKTPSRHRQKKLEQLDFEGRVVQVFPSIQDAVKAFSLNYKSLLGALKHQDGHYKGMRFRAGERGTV